MYRTSRKADREGDERNRGKRETQSRRKRGAAPDFKNGRREGERESSGQKNGQKRGQNREKTDKARDPDASFRRARGRGDGIGEPDLIRRGCVRYARGGGAEKKPDDKRDGDLQKVERPTEFDGAEKRQSDSADKKRGTGIIDEREEIFSLFP